MGGEASRAHHAS